MARKNRRHGRHYLKERRRKLRTYGTPAEATLWTYLKCRQLAGRRFNRQFSIENYIVDFYCHQEKLVIELDGQYHFTPSGQEYDTQRTKRLNKLGYRVIRFENKTVFDNLPWVLEEIERHFTHP